MLWSSFSTNRSSYLYLQIQNDTMIFENPDCEMSAVIAHLLDLLIQPNLYDFDLDVSTPWDLWALGLKVRSPL